MSFTATINRLSSQINLDKPASEYINSDVLSDDDQQRILETFERLNIVPNGDGEDEMNSTANSSFEGSEKKSSQSSRNGGNKRVSQLSGRRNSFLGLDGKVRDSYIAKRASFNKKRTGESSSGTEIGTAITPLADLSRAELITEIDGDVLAQLFLSGYAKLATRVEHLNKINVFPIADGDTGANMKACLRIPARNLLLEPSSSVSRVASNMAADVLLNGQGNSGTILSHFYVCLAEEIRNLGDDPACHQRDALSVDAFAGCLARVGEKMAEAVPRPVEGTLLSVARDSCEGLLSRGRTYANLRELLDAWVNLAETELRATPEKLVVDGVRVLEKAGVYDSGAQGFCYTVEGMWLASNGALPEASDPRLFRSAEKDDKNDDDRAWENQPNIVDDHGVCDSRYRFCTEAVVLLRDGASKEDVLSAIDLQCHEIDDDEAADEATAVVPAPLPSSSSSSSRPCPCGRGSLGDSVACVSAPAKEGGTMVKVHIHTDEPQRFFDALAPFSRDAILKKEKVEDMKAMRDVAAAKAAPNRKDAAVAEFSVIGLSAMCLPPSIKAENDGILHTFPMFMVPSDTEEAVDIRYPSEADVLVALNRQRNPTTAVRMTTATSTPMQMKIELLAALSGGKPVLCFVSSTDEKGSAYGRNVLLAVDMLEPHQREMVRVFVHGWGNDGPFLMEAVECARNGRTIDEAIDACEDLARRTFGRVGFMNAAMFRSMKAWRPAFFPDGFGVPEGSALVSGTPPGIRPTGVPLAERMRLCMAPVGMGAYPDDAFAKAAAHVRAGLAPGQAIGNVLVPCVGRPDLGHRFLRALKEEGVEIVGTPHVYQEGMMGTLMSWGTVNVTYKIIEA